MRGEAGATQAAGARSSALTEIRCSPPLHSRTRTRSGSSVYQPTTSPPEPSVMPSVSQVKRILSPCLKVQSSDRVGELVVDISIFIGGEALWLKPEERSVCERALAWPQIGGSTGAALDVSRDLVDAMAHPSEARMLACHVCRECCFHRCPAQ